jgi:ABC-type polysaccharide/polyol phosphate export permease
VPERFRGILYANPFAPFFNGIHDTVFFFRPVRAADWRAMALVTAASLLVGGAVFERLRDAIAEEA